MDKHASFRTSAGAWTLILGTALLSGCFAGRRGQEPAQALYYSDLGPDAIDVSSYPEQQQLNYRIYTRVCSQCHTLARSNNSPVVSREFWELYIMAMRRRSLGGRERDLSASDTRAILDFLDYDSNVRKTGKKEEFDAVTEELQRRFAAETDERLPQRNNAK